MKVCVQLTVVQITKYAFSGGQDTKEEHRRLGGNTEVDVSYQYLTFFLEDDQRLAQLKQVRPLSSRASPCVQLTVKLHTRVYSLVMVLVMVLLSLQAYEGGEMLTGELKKELITVLVQLVGEHQERRKTITQDVVQQYMTLRPLNFKLAQ